MRSDNFFFFATPGGPKAIIGYRKQRSKAAMGMWHHLAPNEFSTSSVIYSS